MHVAMLAVLVNIVVFALRLDPWSHVTKISFSLKTLAGMFQEYPFFSTAEGKLKFP